MKLNVLFLLLPAALLCGCETRQMNLVAPDIGVFVDRRRPVTEKEIQEAFEQKPTIKAGNTIGIVFVSGTDSSGNAVQVATADESKAWQSAFQDSYLVSDVVFLSSEFTPSVRDVRVLRKNAAMLNCDLLLIYGISCDYSRKANPLSVLYITVIGAFFIPGDTLTAASIAKAALINVRTGHVYAVVEASSSQSTVLPTVWISGSLTQMYRNVSLNALRELRKKLRPIIDRLRDQVVEVAE